MATPAMAGVGVAMGAPAPVQPPTDAAVAKAAEAAIANFQAQQAALEAAQATQAAEAAQAAQAEQATAQLAALASQPAEGAAMPDVANIPGVLMDPNLQAAQAVPGTLGAEAMAGVQQDVLMAGQEATVVAPPGQVVAGDVQMSAEGVAYMEQHPRQVLPPALETPKEVEEDAEDDPRPRVTEEVTCLTSDTTLNIMPSAHGNVLMPLTDGGMQYLLAGARANVGIKYGRYLFEAKIVEILNPAETNQGRGRTPVMPRQLLRIGFSTKDSCLFLGETDDSICFDSEGSFHHGKKALGTSQKFARDQVIGLVLNLEEESPNFNTVSLFRDGVRVSQPLPLPECLKGKPLFPAVTFRNLTVHLNFGPASGANMPFKCRMIQDIATKDAVVKSLSPDAQPKDGKYEVVFPVCLPDEGTFEWLDMFLEQNPEYVELSDRKIVEWAERSGVLRASKALPAAPALAATGGQAKASNDKPDMNFGIAQMDDQSIRRILNAVAQAHHRHFVYMEVRGNLLEEERKETLKRFHAPHFKTVAQVLVGEPKTDFKERMQVSMLKDKQEKADAEFRAKQTEEVNQRIAEKKRKQLEKEQRRVVKAARKMETAQQAAIAQQAAEQAAAVAEAERLQDEVMKQAEAQAAPPAKEAAEKKEEGGEEKEEEAKPPEEPKPAEEPKPSELAAKAAAEAAQAATAAAAEAAAEADAEEVEAEEEDNIAELQQQEPPKVALTDEEKTSWFKKAASATPDLTPWTLSTSFTKFTIPTKDEGFDEVRYEWLQKSKSADYIREWILTRKITLKKEDIVPSEWFNEQWTAWQSQLQKWHQKQSEWMAAKKAAKEAENSKEKEDVAMADGKAEEAADEVELDVFGIADVCDIGGGEPLFANFTFEDWALLSLRYELHLLSHAFRRDVDDAERPGIHIENLLFYYNKYFRKTMQAKNYGVEDFQALVGLIQDAVLLNPSNSVLEAQLTDDLDTFDLFLKLTEESRRERSLQIDSGEDAAKLSFQRSALSANSNSAARGTQPPPPLGPKGGIRAPLPPRALAPPQAPVAQKTWNYPPQAQQPGYAQPGYGQAAAGYAPQAAAGYAPQAGGYYRPPATAYAAGYGPGGARPQAYTQKPAAGYYGKGYGK